FMVQAPEEAAAVKAPKEKPVRPLNVRVIPNNAGVYGVTESQTIKRLAGTLSSFDPRQWSRRNAVTREYFALKNLPAQQLYLALRKTTGGQITYFQNLAGGLMRTIQSA